MGKVYKDKICDECKLLTNVIETWGKKLCKKCYKNKPKKGGGHSGMIRAEAIVLQHEMFCNKDKIELQKTTKGNKTYATIYLTHYPGSLGIVGRQLNYFIKKNGKIIGIIGGNSPPLNYLKFNKYFDNKYTELNWLNNNVFRLLEHEKNLGTTVLKIFRSQVRKDYEEKYKNELIGLVTFVEPPRNGTVYKADNWDFLGETQGKSCKRRGSHGKWINKEWTTGTKKLIFAKKLNKSVGVSRPELLCPTHNINYQFVQTTAHYPDKQNPQPQVDCI